MSLALAAFLPNLENLSIRAMHIPTHLNQGVDMLLSALQGEWRLHPGIVRMVWNCFGEAEEDIFAMSENTHCPQFTLAEQGQRGEHVSHPSGSDLAKPTLVSGPEGTTDGRTLADPNQEASAAPFLAL